MDLMPLANPLQIIIMRIQTFRSTVPLFCFKGPGRTTSTLHYLLCVWFCGNSQQSVTNRCFVILWWQNSGGIRKTLCILYSLLCTDKHVTSITSVLLDVCRAATRTVTSHCIVYYPCQGNDCSYLWGHLMPYFCRLVILSHFSYLQI